MKNKERKIYPPLYDKIEDWPIFKLSEDRRDFVSEIEEFTEDRLLNKPTQQVSDMLAKTIYLERIRIKEEPWKVDPPNERQFWTRLSKKFVRSSLDRTQEEAEAANQTLIKQIIHRYAEEIVGTFRIKTFQFARKFLNFFFSRLLNAAAGGPFLGMWSKKYQLKDKLIVIGKVEEVRSLMKKGTVVIVPTHFSNLDSILIGFALDTFAGLPSFSYGAGLNLYNTGYTAYFMNRLGAYRIDRRKKNPVYLETLKAMSNLSLQRGVNSLFFPGGTRSRSGKLETRLKLGMLSTVVEAQRANYANGKDEKIFVVPLVLSYHFVLEAQFLIEQYLRQIGKEHYIRSRDNFHSLRSILKFAWQVFSKSNEIALNFGQPLDVLGHPVDAEGNSYNKQGQKIDVREYFLHKDRINKDLQRESEYTKCLADRIVDRFHRDNIVLSSHLIAFAAFRLLQHDNPDLDLYGLLRLPTDDYVFNMERLSGAVGELQQALYEMESKQLIQLSPAISLAVEEVIKDGVSHLGNFHVNKPLRFSKEGEIVSDSFKVLYFYHNRLENYDLHRHISWQSKKEALAAQETI